MPAIQRIGIVGTGAWGTALAVVARKAGRDVILRARDADRAATINNRHRNEDYLPGVALDPAIRATADVADLGDCDAILAVAPAQAVRATMAQLAAVVRPDVPLVICAKGLESDTGLLLTEVIDATLTAAGVTPPPLAVLSGPTLAHEVAAGLPAAATIACTDNGVAEALAAALLGDAFRPYASADVIGAQVGGAVKNVIAIACGVNDGCGLGDNSRAALLTRGLAEVTRFAVALGADPATMMGLSGIGDMVLTCAAETSRNHRFGVGLAAGKSPQDLLAGQRAVTEGVATSAAVLARADELGVQMPICTAVSAVIHGGADLMTTIHGLLARPLAREDA